LSNTSFELNEHKLSHKRRNSAWLYDRNAGTVLTDTYSQTQTMRLIEGIEREQRFRERQK